MVTRQSSELSWEVSVELPVDSLSLGRGSVRDCSKCMSLMIIKRDILETFNIVISKELTTTN